MDTGAECTLLHGNPENFLGPEVSIEGYGGQSVNVKAVQLSLDIRCLPSPRPQPREYTVYVFPIPEYILGIDVFQGLWLHTTAGEFCLRVRVVKAILQGRANPCAVATPLMGKGIPQGTLNYSHYGRVGKGSDN